MAWRLPVYAGALLLLAGCHTLLRHPQTDVTAEHGENYGDCASCHEGFTEPVYSDPYAHYSDLWWDYYGCPWWVADCGPAVYPGSGSSVGDAETSRGEGRFIGNRGGAVAGFRTPPPITAPGAPALGSPGTQAPASNPQAPADGGVSNRKVKKAREEAPPGNRDASPDGDKNPRDDKKDKDRPDEADPPGRELR